MLLVEFCCVSLEFRVLRRRCRLAGGTIGPFSFTTRVRS
jgi:hypothetical protein